MSPKLPVCTSQELLRALQKAGWEVHRQKGSHVILKKKPGGRVIVPLHGRDVPTGTLRSIIKDSGMTVGGVRKIPVGGTAPLHLFYAPNRSLEPISKTGFCCGRLQSTRASLSAENVLDVVPLRLRAFSTCCLALALFARPRYESFLR